MPDSISSEEMDKVFPCLKAGSYKVLIVEDNEELLQILNTLFAPFYQVILAGNGEEGLRKANEEKPDLIVSDVMMPLMSGMEMCMKIKNNIDLCHIPVVLLTALDSVGYSQAVSRGHRNAQYPRGDGHGQRQRNRCSQVPGSGSG